MKTIKGSCVALVTPMLPNGDIDWASLEQLIYWHINSGTDAIVVAGTTGEAPTLNVEEQRALFSFVVKKANGKLPIIAGTGTNSTDFTIQRSLMAQDCGVDGLLVVTPYYNRPPQEGLLQHFEKIAKACVLPIYIYDHPGRTGCVIEEKTIATLSQISNIVGVKDATANIDKFMALKSQCHPDFIFLSGDDPTALVFMQQGGGGVISVTTNVAPKQMKLFVETALKDPHSESAITQDITLQSLHKAMALLVNPIPVKCMLHCMGKISTGIRLPLIWPSEAIVEQLNQVAKEYACI